MTRSGALVDVLRGVYHVPITELTEQAVHEVVLGDALQAVGFVSLRRQFAVDLPGYGPARFDLALPQLRWAIEVEVHPTHRETAGLARNSWPDEASTALGWAVTGVEPSGFGSALASTVADLLGQRAQRDEQRAA